MFRIENGWVSSLYDELEFWISIMFVLDLEISWWIRMNRLHIWIEHNLAVPLVYSLCNSGKIRGLNPPELAREDDRSYNSGVWIILGFVVVWRPHVRLRVWMIGYDSLDHALRVLTCWCSMPSHKWNAAFKLLNLSHWCAVHVFDRVVEDILN